MILAYLKSKHTKQDRHVLTDALTTLLTQARQLGRNETATRVHKPTKEGFPGFGDILGRVKGVVQSIVDFSDAFNGDDSYDGMSPDDYADFVAGDEVHGQAQYGALDVYDEYGLPVLWCCEDDACQVCQDNAAEEDVIAGNAFSSGQDAPPAHGRCRCYLVSSDDA